MARRLVFHMLLTLLLARMAAAVQMGQKEMDGGQKMGDLDTGLMLHFAPDRLASRVC